ncbi:hypothetical protein TWF718_005284 [Orbilia javanica]|uniref:Uncharacterized protein n=1 Tax=Orbilia javanica TaxID=47235 RepID=A0AAN8N3D1_9PEZI
MKFLISLSIISLLATTTFAQEKGTQTTSANCSNFTALGGPLGNFCPLHTPNPCCAFICNGPGGQPGGCAQTSASGVNCSPCTTLAPAPTCSSTAVATAKAGLDFESCGSEWDPCCAYVCRENNNSASTSVPVLCVAEPKEGMWCLQCSGRPTVSSGPAPTSTGNATTTAVDEGSGSGGNGTSTGAPVPTYSSGATSGLSLSAGALFGVLALAFTL